MSYKKLFVSLLIINITLFFFEITGCNYSVWHDTLPNDTPKGYVEFYSMNDTFINDIYISKYEKGEKTEGIIISSEEMVIPVYRIAERPGVYDFKVSCGTYVENATVKVIEGMMTPVGIRREITGHDYNQVWHATKVTTYFNMSLAVGKPYPSGKVENIMIFKLNIPRRIWDDEVKVDFNNSGITFDGIVGVSSDISGPFNTRSISTYQSLIFFLKRTNGSMYKVARFYEYPFLKLEFTKL